MKTDGTSVQSIPLELDTLWARKQQSGGGTIVFRSSVFSAYEKEFFVICMQHIRKADPPPTPLLPKHASLKEVNRNSPSLENTVAESIRLSSSAALYRISVI
jgi:hypothetical protein